MALWHIRSGCYIKGKQGRHIVLLLAIHLRLRMKRPFCHLNKKRHLVFWVVWHFFLFLCCNMYLVFSGKQKTPASPQKANSSIRTRSTDLIIKPTGTPSQSLSSSDRTRCILHKQLSMFFRRYHGCWDTVPDSHRLPKCPLTILNLINAIIWNKYPSVKSESPYSMISQTHIVIRKTYAIIFLRSSNFFAH